MNIEHRTSNMGKVVADQPLGSGIVIVFEFNSGDADCDFPGNPMFARIKIRFCRGPSRFAPPHKRLVHAQGALGSPA